MKNKESKELNNRDYISELFASDDIKAPESLSEDAIMSKIEALESGSSSQAKAAPVRIRTQLPAARPEIRNGKRPAAARELSIGSLSPPAPCWP